MKTTLPFQSLHTVVSAYRFPVTLHKPCIHLVDYMLALTMLAQTNCYMLMRMVQACAPTLCWQKWCNGETHLIIYILHICMYSVGVWLQYIARLWVISAGYRSLSHANDIMNTCLPPCIFHFHSLNCVETVARGCLSWNSSVTQARDVI